MKPIVLVVFAFLITMSAPFFLESYSTHFDNTPFVFEGSGFAVTPEQIKLSEIDFGVVTFSSTGMRTNFSVDDGFVTLNAQDFEPTKLSGSFLRDGKFIRISGDVASNSEDVSVRLFGRLIEESNAGSVYGVTGQITHAGNDYKVIYTTKLSELEGVKTAQPTAGEDSIKERQKIIKILPGASTQGFGDTYVDAYAKYSENIKTGENVAQYFTQSRISIKPGDSITVINEDTTSHTLLSGKANFHDRRDPFAADGRIDSGTIAPGGSVTINFAEPGFYRIFDPKYPWMNITVYAFPGDVQEQLIRQGSKPLGN